ncbi:MAG: GTP cyclohydrolase [Allomuricauda sp.]|nr:MAG: GTP cyclohydrolase [Allomuricauda sp.]
MKTIEQFRTLRLMALLFMGIAVISCSDDDDTPEEENEVEVITDVTLVFTNTADASDVVRASAQDPDGAGIQELVVDPAGITLSTDATYTLTFEIFNNLETPGEDIGEEVAEEDDEHQIFFSFTDGAFANPTGNGNVDNAGDAVNYNDQDGNGNPLGLSTTWTTGANPVAGGNFTARLQHQPDIKSATTGAADGDTDFNLSFVLNIQ